MTKPIFTPEQFAVFKEQEDSLLVPIAFWTAHVTGNTRIRYDHFLPTPANIQIGDFIVTEKEWFFDVVRSLKTLYFEYKLIDGHWLVTKLEPKKTMPKIDIFEGGRRQPGSFGSNS